MSRRMIVAMFLLGSIVSQSLYSQEEEPFLFNISQETSLLGAGAVLFAASTYFYLDMMPPDPNILNRDKILSLEMAPQFFNKG